MTAPNDMAGPAPAPDDDASREDNRETQTTGSGQDDRNHNDSNHMG
jgi:hypothetical protein